MSDKQEMILWKFGIELSYWHVNAEEYLVIHWFRTSYIFLRTRKFWFKYGAKVPVNY